MNKNIYAPDYNSDNLSRLESDIENKFEEKRETPI